MYCVYKKYTYRAKLKNGKVILISYERKEGFSNYVDVVGNEHSDIFMKEVELGEVELIYNEDMRLCYLGETFELLEPITATSVENDSYILFTSSEQVAKRFEFEKRSNLYL